MKMSQFKRKENRGMWRERQKGEIEVGTALGLVVGVVFFAAWLTHVIVSLSEGSWGFLIAGAIFFPIGIVHGVGLWFGFF